MASLGHKFIMPEFDLKHSIIIVKLLQVNKFKYII